MVLEDLFNNVKKLNKTYEEIGCTQRYGIKFVGSDIESKYVCFDEVYTDLKKFIQAMSQETYIENVDNSLVQIVQYSREIPDIQYDIIFQGRINGNSFKQTVYAYLSEL